MRAEVLDIPDYGGLQYSFTFDEDSNTLAWTPRTWDIYAAPPQARDYLLKGLGCGKEISWSEMEPISEQEVLELGFQLSDMPQAVTSLTMNLSESSVQTHLNRMIGQERLVVLISKVAARNRCVNSAD